MIGTPPPTLTFLCFIFFQRLLFVFAIDNNIVSYNCYYLDNKLTCSNLVIPPHASASPTPKLHQLVLTFGLGNAIATGVIIIITLLNIIVHKYAEETRQLCGANSCEKLNILSSSSSEKLCRQFSLAEIQIATNNFDDALIIGRGGFGVVYKGLIDNGSNTVAIKRLNPMSKQGAPEFWTEIEMLSKFRHSNLVSLIGYCDDWQEMIIIYEYMVRGTIADHLHKIDTNGNPSLCWVQRLNICIGAARGLDYLHTGTGVRHRVIHRDVKSSNILLDENWAAKISDFGMSKIAPANQSCTHVSTIVKGTYGYLDPEYFLTRRLTKKSDVYAFGVVLFEVLCGRPAVDLSLDEEKWGLAEWARRCIKEGTLDQIIDPTLEWQILPNCLKAFAKIATQCLHKHPKKRPTMAEVVVGLVSAMVLQKNVDSFMSEREIIKIGGDYDNQENADSCTEQGVVIADNGDKQIDGASSQQSRIKSARMTFTRKLRLVTFTRKLRQMTFTRKVQLGVESSEQSRIKPSKMTFTRKLQLTTLTRKLRPFFFSTARLSSDKSGQFEDLTRPQFELFPTGQILPTPDLRIFRFSELKAATRNFRPDTVMGEGGFGKVYKGWLNDNGSRTLIAVKKLNSDSMQGFQEWKAEVEFLGRLSHPNLVRLLGYCWEDKELLLVYEFMVKGSLENHLFGRGSAVLPLPWDIRLKVLIEAARGLAFLHALEKQVIYRDFKTSNILLDGSYNAKLSDFGLAKMGPSANQSHVTTRVMGTYGYAAPEYIATGHLYVKSDVYGFGVVLVEMLTGLRALDTKRPSGQHNLVDWVKPYLSDRRKLKTTMDSKLEGNYPSTAAFQVFQLAFTCLRTEPKTRPSMKEVLETLEQLDVDEK